MFTRRGVMVLMASLVPGLLVGCKADFDPEAIPESVARFPRTPIAGDMTSTRVVLTFYVADDSPVTLRMWTDEGVVVDQAVDPSGDGFHKVFVDDLTPGTTYRYAVFSGEAPDFEDRSLIGQVRTAPDADALVPVTIALLACVGQGTVLPDYYLPEGSAAPTPEPFQWEVYTHAKEHDIDVLVHLGDQAYLDFVWHTADGTYEAYLNAWGYYHGGGYRDLYPLAGLYATWDDHESTDNGNFDPWDMTAEDQAKLVNAQDAWFATVPIDATARGPVWRGFRWGQTVEVLLLDCRYELQPDHQVSEEQLTWLLDRIRQSPCRFVCVASPKPFSVISSTTPLAQDNMERWENYPLDRDRVTALLDELDARHVIFVTGDIHMNYLGRTRLSGEATSDRLWEVCCTSGNVNPLADKLDPAQFEFVDNSPHLPVLTFDPGAGTIHVAFHARDGSLSFERTLDDV
ncbi:MAG: alkaline phosphatase family protein [Alphaproteobacteria bacterium]|nr:alkaline phosphatase family protein [Alphaproteobacteria bacterium]